ncbi:MAG: nuclear transport factor 2 family protein, partial [Cyclobacteriaceae bacterium]
MRVLIILIICLGINFSVKAQDDEYTADERIAAKLAQAQLEAYNNRNIIKFLEPYADDIKAYNYPDALIFEGKDKMRETYGKMFANSPALHCELVHRTVMGNVVIDQERVTGIAGAGDKIVEVLAIYTIK